MHGNAGVTTPPLPPFKAFSYGALCFQDFVSFLALQRELVQPLSGDIYSSHKCIFEFHDLNQSWDTLLGFDVGKNGARPSSEVMMFVATLPPYCPR